MADRTKEFTAEIVASYVEHNTVSAGDLPGLIRTVYGSLVGVAQPAAGEPVATTVARTRAQIRRSFTADAIISFEDGKPYRSMKRHLAKHGLTPQQYREKWGLPQDYPIVAASYSAVRSEMAKRLGLGRPRAATTRPPRARNGRAVASTPAGPGPDAPSPAPSLQAAPKAAAARRPRKVSAPANEDLT
jgi:predicted transcriptional regulator